MGFRDLVLFYVVTGISLRWIATAASVGPSSIAVWMGAWLLFYLPLAVSVIELSSRYPSEGGMYVWASEAFGDGAGFLSGWRTIPPPTLQATTQLSASYEIPDEIRPEICDEIAPKSAGELKNPPFQIRSSYEQFCRYHWRRSGRDRRNQLERQKSKGMGSDLSYSNEATACLRS